MYGALKKKKYGDIRACVRVFWAENNEGDIKSIMGRNLSQILV